MPKFLEIRGRKNTDGTHVEYTCHGCNAKIYYAAFTDDSGAIITEDGQKPNGKFGKESNVKGFKVDVNNKEKIHDCPNYNENTQALIDKSLLDDDSKPGEMSETYQKQTSEYKMNELKMSDIIGEEYIAERKAELDLILADENIIRDYLLEHHLDTNGWHIGLLMKLLDERIWRKRNG
jgi:hypothetical protein